MKKYLMPLVAAILIAGIGCKKYNQDYKPPIQPPTEPPTGKKWVVRTVAGNGTASFVNGSALSATFHFPGDISVDNDGIIYVTDVLNFCIRKIANGGVSNFAGGSGAGIINDIGPSAQFKNPYSVALDANGNLYTSDEDDPRIRKTSPAREVSVYAGIETPGFADGNANTARFGFGNYIVADAEGNVYVSDAMNNRIRKISVTGQVNTIAGSDTADFRDGNGAAAQFSFPGGIAIDRQGNLYVADRGNFRIRKITPAGDVSTFAGSGIPGNAEGNWDAAQFSHDMHDIVIDGQGNLYIADIDRIRKVTPQGVVSTIAGSTFGFRDGDGDYAKFNFPNGLAIDTQGNIYVADLNNNRIRKISFE
jgi:NHL repeat